jgi:hypothetical protein
LNEDTAEPVVINIGLNSQVAALVPSVGENNTSSTPGQVVPASTALLPTPNGEAASIFSGFRFESKSAFPTVQQSTITYDTHIVSQFASGGAAIILASDPAAVDKVVSITEVSCTRSAAFGKADHLNRMQAILDKIDALSDPAKVSGLYQRPPVSSTCSQQIVDAYLAEKGGYNACLGNIGCMRDVLDFRVRNEDPVENLAAWEEALKS